VPHCRQHASEFPTPTVEQASACSAAPREGEDTYAFVVFEVGGSRIDPPQCRYTVHITRDCWPGRCSVSLTTPGVEEWEGTCTSIKGSSVHFRVKSNDGSMGLFNVEGHDEASLRGESFDTRLSLRGRLVPTARPR
jgi:hypothetical protein